MGGLALKHLGVQRIAAEPYRELTATVGTAFNELFGFQILVIPAYADKPDFGDCDVLVVPSLLPQDWREQVVAHFDSPGMVRNGDVTSIAIHNVQFDFISVDDYESSATNAYTYFAYNDLGNLMGRIAHKMGFTYGHRGLVYKVRNKDRTLADIDVEVSAASAFNFMGYDHARWTKGFKTLTDIFEYAASSPFFHPDIYLLHNRNAVSRIRDAKRKTYTEFLKWCEGRPRDGYPWPEDLDQKRVEKHMHLMRAFKRWPTLERKVGEVWAAEYARISAATIWNGDLVREWTGLSGKQLGEFIQVCKSNDLLQSLVASHKADEAKSLTLELSTKHNPETKG